MSTFIRLATRGDIRQMAELAGPPVTAQGLAEWMDDDGAHAAWNLIEDETGALLGFQRVGRSDALPPEACDIATFLAPGTLPVGAAAALFDATAEAARRMRHLWISADVDKGNQAARTYYQNRGFRPYSTRNARVLMRYDLD